MPMLIIQIWALMYKTLLVSLVRRPLSTTIRAFVIPLGLVLVISYAQYFFNPHQHFGIGNATPITPLSTALSRASSHRDTVAFVNSGFIGGDIAAVIDDVATICRGAGKKVVTIADNADIPNICKSSDRGTSNCYGAVVFQSSPNEPTKSGSWNYTLRADTSLGGSLNVRSQNNDPQLYLLPFQQAIDQAIAKHTAGSTDVVIPDVQQYPYTVMTDSHRRADTRSSYLDAIVSFLAVIFLVVDIGVVYQSTGLMATERERGLSM